MAEPANGDAGSDSGSGSDRTPGRTFLAHGSLFSAQIGGTNVSLTKGGYRSHPIHEAILSQYSDYFKFRISMNIIIDKGSSEIQIYWSEVETDVLSLWLDCIHQDFWGKKCYFNGELNSSQASPLRSLELLAKLHQLCQLAQSPIIGSWVQKHFKTTLGEVTLQWGSVLEQDKTLNWAQNAFLAWNDHDCKALIVEKFTKTLPDHEVFYRLLPVMDKAFSDKVSISLLKRADEKNTKPHTEMGVGTPPSTTLQVTSHPFMHFG